MFFKFSKKNHLNDLEKNVGSENGLCVKYLEDDIMEIKRENIFIFPDVLGEGAFGVVRKGVLDLNSSKLDVAVKMIRDKPIQEELHEFYREIETMKEVGKHENIVGIIGHCTENPNEIMLLTEYCSKGNLLNYLR